MDSTEGALAWEATTDIGGCEDVCEVLEGQAWVASGRELEWDVSDE
jgi:hypothetical protein